MLGALLLGQQRYAEAERVLERSLAIWQGKFGPQHYELAVVTHNLAAVSRDLPHMVKRKFALPVTVVTASAART